MDISFIIVNWNTKELLLNCLRSIYRTVKGIEIEVFVVDNGSIDGSSKEVRAEFPQVRLIENEENLGFAKATNQALRKMSGRYAVLLNTDCILEKGAIRELISFMDRNKNAGIAGGRLLNADGTRQNSVDNFPSLITTLVSKNLLILFCPKRFPSKRMNYRGPLEVDSVIGACMMVRKKAIDEVGLLDEDYFFFVEETDWSYRMRRQGWKTCHVPTAKIVHLQGKTADKFPSPARIEYYRSRYKFLEKIQGRSALIAVRIGIPIRLVIDISLKLIGAIFTLGLVHVMRRKIVTYARLLSWHLRSCPVDAGLREISFSIIKKDGIRLKMRNQYRETLLRIWEMGRLGEGRVAEIIKNGHQTKLIKDHTRSTVVSLLISGERIILKRYKYRSFIKSITDMFRSSKAKRAWINGNRLLEIGVRVATPLVLGEQRICRFLRESFLITKAIPDAHNARDYLSHLDDNSERMTFLEALAKSIRHIHAVGVFHNDLKATNILIKKNEPGGLCFYFTDLEDSRIGKAISPSLRIKDLASFINSVPGIINQDDLLRFFGFYSQGDRAIELNKRKYLSKIGIQLKKEDTFVRVRKGAMKLILRKGYEEDLLRLGLEKPAHLLTRPDARALKNHGKEVIISLTINHNSQAEKITLKQYKYRRWQGRVKDIFRTSKAMKEWKIGNKLLARGIRTPLPLAAGERRRFRLVGESFLITQEIPSVNLDTHFSTLTSRLPEKLKEKRAIIHQIGKRVRQIHDQGFSHGDLRLENMLMENDGKGHIKLYFLDFENSRLARRISSRQRTKDLARLNLAIVDSISKTDRLRFFNSYSQGNKSMKKYLKRIEKYTLKKKA